MEKIVLEWKTETIEDEARVTAMYLNITVRQSRQSGVARATCPD